MNKRNKIIFLITLLLLFILIMIYYLIIELKSPIRKNISICFVGDIIPHCNIISDKNIPDLFTHVSNRISGHDIAFGNLEGSSASPGLRHDHYRAFNAPETFLQDLKKAGFDLLNIANNHLLDCEYEGFKQTIRNLNKYSFLVSGLTIHGKPHTTIIEINNIKIGILGLTLLLNYPSTNKGATNVCFYKNIEDSLAYIQEADKNMDFLIVSVHWGREYNTNYQKLKKYANKIFKAGADCIIGHHPHILLPIEYEKEESGYKNITAFSLGDFIANIGKEYKTFSSRPHEGRPRRSIILSLLLSKIKNKIYTKEIKIIPVWIHNNYLQYKNHKEKSRQIFPVLLKDCAPEILSKEEKKFELQQIYKELQLDRNDLRK